MFKKIVGLGFSTKGKNAKDVKKYIKTLLDSGANEFFTGYNPSYWYEKFGFEISPNGRFAEHEQITDVETLKLITEEIHKHGFEIFANLNAWYYTNVTFPYIKKMVKECISMGIDGIICGNISILEYLHEINYKGKINISTIFSLYNTESIRFFLENYNVNKIIFSREITLKEFETIVTTFPETSFEVFGEGDFCRYNNGLCFAEHKYSTRDICTVVVDDLIFKKRYRPDFKEIALNKDLSNFEKIELFDDTYLDDFDLIEKGIENMELSLTNDKKNSIKEIINAIKRLQNKVDLYYDALKGPLDKDNKKILNLLKYLKYVKSHTNEFDEFFKELEKTTKSGMEYYFKKLKELGAGKLKALEKQLFYSKGDNLNMYSYLFFSKFKNIETVKFPTRGRNYNEKLEIIQETVKSGKIKKDILDRSISMKRAHYDLSYLFEDKLRFRNMLKNI